MPDVTYRIIFENNTNEDSTPVSVDGSQQQNDGNKPAKPNKKKDGGSFADIMVATNIIKPYVTQLANSYISQVEFNTGSSELQRKYQAYSSIAGSVGGIISAGIATGPVGAASATALMAAQVTMQAITNSIQIQNQKIIEQENIQLRTSRLGMSVNRSRGGNVV